MLKPSKSPLPPIFIHSTWRAGSTYVYSLFRRQNQHYYAFQEPLNEAALLGRDDPDLLLTSYVSITDMLRHPELDRPYFQELFDTAAAWRGVVDKKMLYDDFFGTDERVDTAAFFEALISASPRRPVFQECRTGMRIAKLRERLGGVHIALIRNPRDTWWSYKATDFFDVARGLCINAVNPPPIILALRDSIGFEPVSDPDIMVEHARLGAKRRSPEDSYFEQFVLWMLGVEHALEHADVILDMDRLTQDPALRVAASSQLRTLGIPDIDLGEAAVPQRRYYPEELSFFEAQEARAIELFQANGLSSDRITAFMGDEYWSGRDEKSASEPLEYRRVVMRLETQAANESARIQQQGYFTAKALIDKQEAWTNSLRARIAELETLVGQQTEHFDRQQHLIQAQAEQTAALLAERADREVQAERLREDAEQLRRIIETREKLD